MSDQEIRLECLRMAHVMLSTVAAYTQTIEPSDDVPLAQKYYDFVMGKESK